MKLIKFLKSLFVASSMPASTTPTQVPPPAPPKPEPSCFAKGVAELWKRGEGWQVSKRQSVKGKSYHGDYFYWNVWLSHQSSGLQIQLSEHNDSLNISLDKVTVNGETKIYGNSYPNPDGRLIKEVILARPYPALKKRLDKKVKDDATRAARLKEIEALGCPNPESPKTREMISKVIQTSPANEGRYFELEGEQNP